MPTAHDIQTTLVNLGVHPARAREHTIDILRRVEALGRLHLLNTETNTSYSQAVIETRIGKALIGEPVDFVAMVSPFLHDIAVDYASVSRDIKALEHSSPMASESQVDVVHRRVRYIIDIIDTVVAGLTTTTDPDIDQSLNTVLNRLADADFGNVTINQYGPANWLATLFVANDYEWTGAHTIGRGDTMAQALGELADRLNTDVA